MKRVLIGICTASLLSACSSPAIKDTSHIELAAINMVESGEQDINGIISEVRDLQIQAQQADLYLYSPKHMAQAEEEMSKAEEAIKLKKPDHEILTHSLTAKTLFQRGLKLKPIVEQNLKPSFDALEMLKTIDAHVLLKDDYSDLQDELTDLIHLIEDGQTNEANQEQQAFLKDVAKLEIATLKTAYFIPAEKALDKAEEFDAEDYATKTFEAAEKNVEKLELFIESQYKDRQAVKDASTAAIHLCQHAENIAKAVKPLIGLKAEQGEQHILFVESLLNRITTALNHENIAHMPLNKQSIALAQKVETLNKQAQTNQNNPKWSAEKAELDKTIEKLKAELANKEKELKEAQQPAPQVVEPTETSQEKADVAQKEMSDDIQPVPAQSNSESPEPSPEVTIETPAANEQEAIAESTDEASAEKETTAEEPSNPVNAEITEVTEQEESIIEDGEANSTTP